MPLVESTFLPQVEEEAEHLVETLHLALVHGDKAEEIALVEEDMKVVEVVVTIVMEETVVVVVVAATIVMETVAGVVVATIVMETVAGAVVVAATTETVAAVVATTVIALKNNREQIPDGIRIPS
jgi:hypothetical protein